MTAVRNVVRALLLGVVIGLVPAVGTIVIMDSQAASPTMDVSYYGE